MESEKAPNTGQKTQALKSLSENITDEGNGFMNRTPVVRRVRRVGK